MNDSRFENHAPTPMRLAILVGALRGGGTEKFVRLFVRHADRRLAEPVVVFVGDRPQDLREAAGELGCLVHAVPWSPSSSRLVSFLRLVRLLRCLSPDCVYCLQGVLTLIGPVAARLAGVQCVAVAQRNMGHSLTAAPARRRLQGWVYHRLVSGVLVNADAIRQSIVSVHGLPTEKIHVIPNPLEAAPFVEPDPAPLEDLTRSGGRRPVVTIVGRLHRVKNHGCFLRAAARIRQAGVEAEFLVVGDGPLEAELRETSARLGLSDCVSFVGARDDVAPILKSSAMVMVTSRDEGVPNVILEALAAGTPVIGARVGGVSEVLREPSWLVTPDDDEGFARAVLAVLADPAGSRSRAARLGQRLMVEHDPVETARRHLLVLRELWARASGRSRRSRGSP